MYRALSCPAFTSPSLLSPIQSAIVGHGSAAMPLPRRITPVKTSHALTRARPLLKRFFLVLTNANGHGQHAIDQIRWHYHAVL